MARAASAPRIDGVDRPLAPISRSAVRAAASVVAGGCCRVADCCWVSGESIHADDVRAAHAGVGAADLFSHAIRIDYRDAAGFVAGDISSPEADPALDRGRTRHLRLRN